MSNEQWMSWNNCWSCSSGDQCTLGLLLFSHNPGCVQTCWLKYWFWLRNTDCTYNERSSRYHNLLGFHSSAFISSYVSQQQYNVVQSKENSKGLNRLLIVYGIHQWYVFSCVMFFIFIIKWETIKSRQFNHDNISPAHAYFARSDLDQTQRYKFWMSVWCW